MKLYRKVMRIFMLVISFGAIARGLAYFVASGIDSRALSGDISDFNRITSVSEFTEGEFVKGRASRLGDEFACTEPQNTGLFGLKSNTELHYYVMPLENIDGYDVKYIALCIGKKEAVSKAEVMVKEFNDYWANGVAPEKWTTMNIKGKVSRLDDELYKQFYDVISGGDEEASPEDIEPYIIPYVITYFDTASISRRNDLGINNVLLGSLGFFTTEMLFRSRKRNYGSEGDDENCEEEENKDTDGSSEE